MAKVITFSADANLRITFSGGTEADPVTMADLYAADVAGGWGVVENPAPRLYTVRGQIFASTTDISYFRLSGEYLVSEDLQGDGYTQTVGLNFSTLCDCRMYGSSLLLSYGASNSNSRPDRIYVAGPTRLEKCTIAGWPRFDFSLGSAAELVDFFSDVAIGLVSADTVLTRANIGEVFRPGGESDRVTARNLWVSNRTVTARNALIVGYLRVTGPADPPSWCVAIDPAVWPPAGGVVFNSPGGPFAGEHVEVRHTLPLTVVDGAGNPVDGAVVTLTDQHGTEQASWTTGADGLPPSEQTAPRERHEHDGSSIVVTNHNPYQVRVDYPDGLRVEIEGVQIEAPLAMTVARPDHPADYAVDDTVTFAHGSVAGLAVRPDAGEMVVGAVAGAGVLLVEGTLDLGSYVLIADVVSPGFVVSGNDNYVGGEPGTYPTSETSKAEQLVEDVAAITYAKASILDTATILGVSGEFDLSLYVAKVDVVLPEYVLLGKPVWTGGPDGELLHLLIGEAGVVVRIGSQSFVEAHGE